MSLTDNLSPEYLLSYLVNHDLEDALHFFDPEGTQKDHPIHKIVQDKGSCITLRVKIPGDPLVPFQAQLFVEAKAVGVYYSPKFLYERPGTVFQNLNRAPGVLYYRGDPPAGLNECWVQQYPPSDPKEKIGRTVVEFYTDKKITAVFKTNTDNYGALGLGSWSKKGIWHADADEPQIEQ